MMRFTKKSRTVRAAAAAAVVTAALGAVVSVGSEAGAGGKPGGASFTLKPLAKFVPCMAADGKTPPTVNVQVRRGGLNDTMNVTGSGFKPGLQFDLFTIENSRLNAAGALDPNFKGFGMSWYQSDLQAGGTGHIEASIRTILVDQIFGLVDGGATPVGPKNTFHVGFWFNNPADAAACGFTGTTPFNGDHTAGPLAAVSVPDGGTNLGPLCTDPVRSGTSFKCNP